jgi:hypothetical protein
MVTLILRLSGSFNLSLLDPPLKLELLFCRLCLL